MSKMTWLCIIWLCNFFNFEGINFGVNGGFLSTNTILIYT